MDVWSDGHRGAASSLCFVWSSGALRGSVIRSETVHSTLSAEVPVCECRVPTSL